ncbi:hypothetical protein QE250_05945 [Chromatiaceae bacterium AAb-1]|nr:hypothetical protein [Chromatiaceae bacterium AAb-1]
MSDFLPKYQRWLNDFSDALHQTEQQQLNRLVHFGETLKAYLKAGKALSAYETQLFAETLKRQWQETAAADSDSPSLWPEALWQELSLITDRTQVEWRELLEDFQHNGIYFQGEWVGMGRYCCARCQQKIDYTHPAELLICSKCGGVRFSREGLPV